MKKIACSLGASLMLIAGAQASIVIGSDNFDDAGTYSSRTFSATANTTTTTFDIVSRDTILNAAMVDTSVSASPNVALDEGDSLGFLESTDTDNFLGMDRAAARTLTYTFDISGYTGLNLSMDWIFGENWTSTAQVTAYIDGGEGVEVFSVVKDTTDASLAMEDGNSATVVNTASVNGNLLTDTWTTYGADITGTGSLLTLVISESSSYSGNIGIDNIVLAAVPEPATFGMLGFGLVALMITRRRRAVK